MRVINLGSLNIDHVYHVPHFVRPGETLHSTRYELYAGGKGFNQSVALARAGVSVEHTGQIGAEGEWLRNRLKAEGVDTRFVHRVESPTGHAIIQINPSGENAIFLFGGANRTISEQSVRNVLSKCQPGETLLLQNETSAVPTAMQTAAERGMKVVFNPAPMTPEALQYPLGLVDLFILNETEAEGLTGETVPRSIQTVMVQRFPKAKTVLTLGAQGAIYFDDSRFLHQPSPAVNAIDTTAAGDTFTGYFLAEFFHSHDPKKALAQGCRAAALCVTRRGAADSIPYLSELGGPE